MHTQRGHVHMQCIALCQIDIRYFVDAFWFGTVTRMKNTICDWAKDILTIPPTSLNPYATMHMINKKKEQNCVCSIV